MGVDLAAPGTSSTTAVVGRVIVNGETMDVDVPVPQHVLAEAGPALDAWLEASTEPAVLDECRRRFGPGRVTRLGPGRWAYLSDAKFLELLAGQRPEGAMS